MNVFGHFLLFTPIIKLLAWIPLVGTLLSSVLAFAVAIFALVWGTTLHLLLMAVSWIVYRPLYGALLLTAVAVGVGVLCYGGDGQPLSVEA